MNSDIGEGCFVIVGMAILICGLCAVTGCIIAAMFGMEWWQATKIAMVVTILNSIATHIASPKSR